MIYLLYDYDDHGPQSIAATLDKGEVQGLFDAYMAEFPKLDGWKDEMSAKLTDLLGKADSEIIGPHHLTGGWGGLTLHVVKFGGWRFKP